MRIFSRSTGPVLPSSLSINKEAWAQYSAWIKERKTNICLILGAPAIGKETMARLAHRICNYREILIDGSEGKEGVLKGIEEVNGMKGERDIRGRKICVIFRDLDLFCLEKVLGVRKTKIPIIIIANEISKKIDISKIEIVRCYSDTYRVLKRIESIGKGMGIAIPDEIVQRAKNGEKIGKLIADMHLYKVSRNVKSIQGTYTGRTGPIDLMKQLLYSRENKRMRYRDVERVCRDSNVQNISDLVFENYQEKCMLLEDICEVSESISSTDRGNRWETDGINGVCVYKQHLMLSNNLGSSFKLPISRKKEKEGKAIIYNEYPYEGWKILPYLEEIVKCLVRKIEQKTDAVDLDEFTKKAVRSIIHHDKALKSIVDEKTREILERVNHQQQKERKRTQPRYIYKTGHSYYATREITLAEILGEINE